MGPSHEHGTASYSRAFAVGVVLNLGFVAVEFIYGQLAHSLALVADAGHNLSDVLALLLVWGAAVLARRRPRPGRSSHHRGQAAGQASRMPCRLTTSQPHLLKRLTAAWAVHVLRLLWASWCPVGVLIA